MGGYPSAEVHSVYSTAHPQPTGQKDIRIQNSENWVTENFQPVDLITREIFTISSDCSRSQEGSLLDYSGKAGESVEDEVLKCWY